MRKATLVAAVFMGLTATQAAEAQVMPVVAGGVLGGLAGSIYASGLQATMASVGSGVASTAGAVVSVVPATASAVAGTIAAASAPVIIGVVAGGALGYALVRSQQ